MEWIEHYKKLLMEDRKGFMEDQRIDIDIHRQ